MEWLHKLTQGTIDVTHRLCGLGLHARDGEFTKRY